MNKSTSLGYTNGRKWLTQEPQIFFKNSYSALDIVAHAGDVAENRYKNSQNQLMIIDT
jgi:hypothetical protein